jgi:hypothetical protein
VKDPTERGWAVGGTALNGDLGKGGSTGSRVATLGFRRASPARAGERASGSGVGLEIACQAPETAEPGKGAFDDPALGYDPTAVGERSTISIVP